MTVFSMIYHTPLSFCIQLNKTTPCFPCLVEVYKPDAVGLLSHGPWNPELWIEHVKYAQPPRRFDLTINLSSGLREGSVNRLILAKWGWKIRIITLMLLNILGFYLGI